MSRLVCLTLCSAILAACSNASDDDKSTDATTEDGTTGSSDSDDRGDDGGGEGTGGDGTGDDGTTDDTGEPPLAAWTLPDGDVGTLIGNGEYTSVNGTIETASIAEPIALAFSPAGDLYIAEAMGNLRKLDPEGNLTTLYLDFDLLRPTAIAFDADGIMYVADGDLDCIVQVIDESVRPFAGSCGVTGHEDGAPGLFNLPRSLSFTASGDLLVADSENMRLRSVTPDGVVSTLAGYGAFTGPTEGPALSASVYLPFAILEDDDGTIWFSGMDHCIRRLVDGQVENVAGLCANYNNTGTTDGSAIDARFDMPWGLAMEADGTLLIADAFNDRIRTLSSDRGTVSTVTGSGSGFADGSLDEALFYIPRGIAVHPDGWVAVADSSNHRVRYIRR